MAAESLCARDRDVLESIFSPNLTFGLEYLLPESEERESVVNGHDKQETENERKSRELELLAIRKAEEGDLETALRHLNEALHCCPDNASLYNNRAQVFLLKGKC